MPGSRGADRSPIPRGQALASPEPHPRGRKAKSRAWRWKAHRSRLQSAVRWCRAGGRERQCPSLSEEVHFQGKMPFPADSREPPVRTLSPKYKFSLLGGTAASPFFLRASVFTSVK